MKFFKKTRDYIAQHGFSSFFYVAKLMLLRIRRIVTPRGHVVRRVNDSYKMYLDISDTGISQALYLYGTREKDQVYIVQNVLKRGMKVLDIGANIGYYVLLEAGIIGDSGRIYAFEPHLDNVNILKKNIELNGFSDRIELSQRGISDKDGTMEFFVSPKSNLHTLNPSFFKPTKTARFNGSIKIDVVDIKRVLREKSPIDFVRMDVEGHEVEVLGGLCEALEYMKVFPSILFETHFPRYDDIKHDMRSVLRGLFERGYKVEAIVSNDESKGLLRKAGYRPKKVLKTDLVHRGIYRNINTDDALRFICDTGGIRAVFLKNEKATI
ncbi:FkbM family methyltransferase [Omnitrophica bacterium]|nr:FkbM family methyltransferase [Candidatus Omnitrophota bacterium]